MRILFYVPEVNTRWLYTLDFIFRKRGLKYHITEDWEKFKASNAPKINCGTQTCETALFWPHSGMLNEFHLWKGSIGETQKDLHAFAFNGVFDPLSSIFFVLSRMEEYLIDERDKHNRFSPLSSYQFQYGWLEQCICDRWAEWLLMTWSDGLHFPLEKNKPSVQLLPTFDIDNAFAYKLKLGTRKLMSIVKDISKFDRQRLLERKRVLSQTIQDPYDTFELIENIAKHFPVQVFWLVGEYASYDRNISIEVEEHQELIRDISNKVAVGIHPSYRSNNAKFHLWKEMDSLKQVLGPLKPLTAARQHFLRLHLPETYRNYLNNKVQDDYTMGFADRVGFRMGTAHPMQWFDLERNVVTDLTIHPFAYMDGSLLEYMELSIDEAKDKIDQLYDEVKQFGGEFSFIWHNETIGNYGKWEGWSRVLQHTLNLKNRP